MSYLKTTLVGLSWTTTLKLFIRILAIGKTALLARLLLPEQFGVFGIAAMVLALLEIATETGINIFLLQQKGDYREYLDTAWVVSISRGFIIGLLIILFTPLVAEFFDSLQAIPLLYLSAVIPVIRGFINPGNIIFQKEMRFDREFYYRFVIILVEILTTLAVAWQFRSAISFVWGLIFAAIVEVLFSFAFVKPWPILKFDKIKLRHIFDRGKWITGFGILDYFFTQGDNIAVGRMLGESSLGIYRTSYSLSTLPVTEIGDIFYKVTFPLFVQVSNDLKRLRSMVLRSVSWLVCGMSVVGILVFWFADPLVRVVLGNQWLSSIPVIKILAITGMFRSLSFSFNSFFVALEKQKYVTAIVFTSTLVLWISIIPLISKFGIIGAAYASALGSILAIPVALYFVLKTIK